MPKVPEGPIVETRTREKQFQAWPPAYGHVTGRVVEDRYADGTILHRTEVSESLPAWDAEDTGGALKAINAAASWALREVEAMKRERWPLDAQEPA